MKTGNVLTLLLSFLACASAFQRLSSRSGLNLHTPMMMSSDFDPLNLCIEEKTVRDANIFDTKPATMSAVFTALLVPTQEVWAKGGEYGLLEGRTASLMHPITMFALFGTSVYSASLGLKYRQLRTIGEVSLKLS